MGTIGELRVGDALLYTIERPWKPARNHPAGTPFESCVPDGIYELEAHDTEAHPRTYCLINELLGVTHGHTSISKRWACLLHVANRAREVSGCIGPGLQVGVIDREWAVLRSRDAMNILRDASPRRLVIRWGTGGGSET